MAAKSSGTGVKLLVVGLALAGAGWAVAFFMRPVVTVYTVAKGDVARVVYASVVVEPGVVSQIMSEVEGRLKTSKLEPGREMTKGAEMALIATADVDLEIARAKSELSAAEKRIAGADALDALRDKTAEEDHAETKRLYEAGKVIRVEWERKERAKKEAEESKKITAAENERVLAAWRNTLDTLELKKKKMSILAPFDGVVTQTFVNPEDLVPAKQALALAIPHSRRVRAKVAEEDFAAVQEGQKAKVSLLGYEGQIFDATVESKLPTAEAGTQRYSVFLKVTIDERKLVPDLTGDVAITIDERRDVLVVPSRAVVNGRVVLVKDGRVQWHHVDVGYGDFLTVEVKNKLAVGDRVVIERLDSLREEDGQRVRVVEAK